MSKNSDTQVWSQEQELQQTQAPPSLNSRRLLAFSDTLGRVLNFSIGVDMKFRYNLCKDAISDTPKMAASDLAVFQVHHDFIV